MHIVLLAPEDLAVPPAQGGSVQIYLDALCRALTPDPDWRVTLISPGNQPGSYEAVDHLVLSGGSSYHARAMQLISQLAPDYVQIENRPALHPLVQEAAPRAQVVVGLHSTTFLSPRRLARQHAATILRQSSAVIVNSQYLKQRIADQFQLGAEDWNPAVIYPGVDHEAFSPVLRPSALNDRPFRILYVGRIIRQKGVHVLVRAVRHLCREGLAVELTLVGRQAASQRDYAALVHRLARGLPIRWAGFVPRRELPNYYRDHDVLVCPSQYNEAFGLVNVEALASGLPVVASRVGGIPEVVDSSCGVLVRHADRPQAFARAIARLIRSPKKRRQLGEAARNRAARFRWQRTALNWLELYRKLDSTARQSASVAVKSGDSDVSG